MLSAFRLLPYEFWFLFSPNPPSADEGPFASISKVSHRLFIWQSHSDGLISRGVCQLSDANEAEISPAASQELRQAQP